MNFFWIGNKWGLCKGLKYGECYYNYSDKKTFISNIFSSFREKINAPVKKRKKK